MKTNKRLIKQIITSGVVLGITLMLIEFLALKMGILFSDIMGFVFLIVTTLSLMLAVRKYRDSELGGFINFGDAFLYSFFACMISGFIWAAYRFAEYSLAPDVLNIITEPAIKFLDTSTYPIYKETTVELKKIFLSPAFWALSTFFFNMTLGGSLLSLYIAFILRRKNIKLT